jgi:GT2 family glycosyltransferase
MSSTEPDVLAVVPTLGERLDTLQLALESLSEQDVPIRLLIVAPARSFEVLRPVVQESGGELVEDRGIGLSAAMNVGLSAARHERYYLWLNDDDLLRPRGVARLLDLFAQRPDASVAYGACDYLTPDGEVIGTSRAGSLAARILPWGPNLVPMPAALTRLDLARKVGAYDESNRYSMDLDLLLRLRKEGPLAATRETVAAFRWHPDSLTVANRRASVREAEQTKRRHLPPHLRPVSPMWSLPVRGATILAAKGVQRRADRVAAAAKQAAAGVH